MKLSKRFERGVQVIAASLLISSNLAWASSADPVIQIQPELGPIPLEPSAEIQLPAELSVLSDIIQLLNLESRVPELPEDAESIADLPPALQAEVQGLVAELQQNALVNGEFADFVTALLQRVNVQTLTERLGAGPLFSELPLIERLGLNTLPADAQQGLSSLVFLLDILTFRFETESNGIRRTHAALLNTPVPLNVDGGLLPDVVALLRVQPAANGRLELVLDVRRSTDGLAQAVGGLLGRLTNQAINVDTFNFGSDLPLTITAVVDVPLSSFTGGAEPPLRVRFGFASDSGIPNRATLTATVDNAASGEALAANVRLETARPTEAFSLIAAVSQNNVQTGQAEPQFDFALDLSPVPQRFDVAAALGQNLDVLITSSIPTTPALRFAVADSVDGSLRVAELPRRLGLFLGEVEGDQVLRFDADAAIGELLAAVNLADGFDITAALRELPPAASLNLGDGSGINLDLGGARIGEIAFTLTDGPAPRNVPEGIDGAVVDLSEGLVVGGRFKGFEGLSFVSEPSLALSAQLDTDRAVQFDVQLEDGSFAQLDFSSFPRQLNLALDDSGLFGVTYQGSETIDTVSIVTDLGLDLVTALIEPMPLSLSLCADQNANGCTGRTGGNVIDASFLANQPLTLNAFICLEGDCAAPSQFVRLEPLSFERFQLSANVGQGCINIPFLGQQCLGNGSAGNFFINTDARPLAGSIEADLGSTEVRLNGGLAASNRTLNYNAARLQFNRAGSMQCDNLRIDVIVGGTNISQFLDPADLLCN
jgi:hypothetical protein